jgi:hypothetical protein
VKKEAGTESPMNKEAKPPKSKGNVKKSGPSVEKLMNCIENVYQFFEKKMQRQ